MFTRRILLSLAVFLSFLVADDLAVAKNAHHNNGHNLLGSKINQNGKHEIDKIGNNSVVAEVNNKKVINMSAGGLPLRKVKSNKKRPRSNAASLSLLPTAICNWRSWSRFIMAIVSTPVSMSTAIGIQLLT